MKKLRFPKSLRLLNKTEYTLIFDQSQKMNQRYLSIRFKENFKPHSRLGLVVGKRVAKHAVIRNRIKRIIRESFRFHQAKLHGFDIIVIAHQSCDTVSKIKLRQGIDQLWEKLVSY